MTGGRVLGAAVLATALHNIGNEPVPEHCWLSRARSRLAVGPHDQRFT